MAKGKYKEWLTEEGLLRLEGWARDGLTDEQIAKNIGITTSTFYEWKKKYAEFSDVLKKGKEVVDIQVENALLKRALGFHYEEELVAATGEVVQVTRYEKPDVTAAIFWLKNRKPNTWRNKEKVDIDKIKADIELTKEKTKLIKGTDIDTSLMKALIEGRKQYDKGN
ncbi:transposase [Gracilibacillus dipsosauri]|uniref:transposase n=1 Tax=Gracilibacillus dipsosauri TaxID=178340 RepID=UPI001C643E87|nr:transposase [Gracilibacillus dipsosauri]